MSASHLAIQYRAAEVLKKKELKRVSRRFVRLVLVCSRSPEEEGTETDIVDPDVRLTRAAEVLKKKELKLPGGTRPPRRPRAAEVLKKKELKRKDSMQLPSSEVQPKS